MSKTPGSFKIGASCGPSARKLRKLSLDFFLGRNPSKPASSTREKLKSLHTLRMMSQTFSQRCVVFRTACPTSRARPVARCVCAACHSTWIGHISSDGMCSVARMPWLSVLQLYPESTHFTGKLCWAEMCVLGSNHCTKQLTMWMSCCASPVLDSRAG